MAPFSTLGRDERADPMTRSGRRRGHPELHAGGRIGWLRAAVLGANDGIVSTASLLVGVAAAGADRSAILTAGVAGLVAGAMSMAVGEFISVSSQADTERADIATERRELAADPVSEQRELAAIYEDRGLEPALAAQVAEQMMRHDALGAHQRDELGITDVARARPLQAAAASAASFTVGAALPLAAALLAPRDVRIVVIAVSALAALTVLGLVSARAGNAPARQAIVRIGVLSAVAMAVTALIGLAVGQIE
jgi:vacuolar iron transporter family protein